MKRKRSASPERRRSMPEIDLNDDRRSGGPSMPKISRRFSRRGCAQLFGQVLLLVAIVGSVIVGLR